jgi:hypothetical protein
MPFKSIAVFIDPTSAGEARISYAVRMASRYGAHLIGIFLVPFVSVASDSVAQSFVEGQQAIQQVIASYQAREAAVIDDAKRDFSACCTREDVSFEFRFLHQGDFHDGIALNCMHTDLVIVGSPRSPGLPDDWSAESLLLATGVPFLLLPGSQIDSAAEHVVVAWNANREARRAVADALPLLISAESVTILVVDPQKNPRYGEEPGSDMARYLVPHRSDYDGLIPSQFRIGRSFGATRIWMLRATPG